MTGRCNRPSSSLLLSFILATGSSVIAFEPAQKADDKSSIEVVVRGCLKGREITADEVAGAKELANASGLVFRLSAKGDLSKEIKKQNGHYIEATGLVKKTALATPGLKLGGGRIVIGGGPVAQDPTRNPSRNPTTRLIPLDVTALEMIAEKCR